MEPYEDIQKPEMKETRPLPNPLVSHYWVSWVQTPTMTIFPLNMPLPHHRHRWYLKPTIYHLNYLQKPCCSSATHKMYLESTSCSDDLKLLSDLSTEGSQLFNMRKRYTTAEKALLHVTDPSVQGEAKRRRKHHVKCSTEIGVLLGRRVSTRSRMVSSRNWESTSL